MIVQSPPLGEDYHSVSSPSIESLSCAQTLKHQLGPHYVCENYP